MLLHLSAALQIGKDERCPTACQQCFPLTGGFPDTHAAMLTLRQTYKRIPKKSELMFVYNALTAKGAVEPHGPLLVRSRRQPPLDMVNLPTYFA